jgi:hypothetical protein
LLSEKAARKIFTEGLLEMTKQKPYGIDSTKNNPSDDPLIEVFGYLYLVSALPNLGLEFP